MFPVLCCRWFLCKQGRKLNFIILQELTLAEIKRDIYTLLFVCFFEIIFLIAHILYKGAKITFGHIK